MNNIKKQSIALSAIAMLFCGAAVAGDDDIPWTDIGPSTPVATPPVDQGHGTIKFIGAIIDAPCSIAPESVDQTVQMGEIANSLLAKNGATPLRPFEIHLEACDFTTAMNATVTFNGVPFDSKKTSLALNGGGSGGAIALVNKQSGEDIVLGKPTKVANLVNGDNHLKFGAKVIGVKAATITTGEFDASSDFIMTYQ